MQEPKLSKNINMLNLLKKGKRKGRNTVQRMVDLPELNKKVFCRI